MILLMMNPVDIDSSVKEEDFFGVFQETKDSLKGWKDRNQNSLHLSFSSSWIRDGIISIGMANIYSIEFPKHQSLPWKLFPTLETLYVHIYRDHLVFPHEKQLLYYSQHISSPFAALRTLLILFIYQEIRLSVISFNSKTISFLLCHHYF